MFKRILKWFFSIALLAVIALAIFLINLTWFRPWSLNLFYEKVFSQVVFYEPLLLSFIDFVERFGLTGLSAKLGDASPGHQQPILDRAIDDLAALHTYRVGTRGAPW